MIVLHHSWGPPETIDRLAERYPNIKMLTGHAMDSQKAFDAFSPVIRRRPNVFVTMTNNRQPGLLEAMVRTFGDGRVVMGSDFVLHTVEFSIGNIAYARIPDLAKRNILGLNMKRVLDELGYWETWGYPQAVARVEK
jgi:predicted TIM-barrel fold metal-dependent hydrolase